MRTRIAIDPNIRVRGNQTFAGLEDVEGIPVVGGAVEVWEPESKLSGSGRVTEIDHDRNLVYLTVDWASMRGSDEHVVPSGTGAARAKLIVKSCLTRFEVSGSAPTPAERLGTDEETDIEVPRSVTRPDSVLTS